MGVKRRLRKVINKRLGGNLLDVNVLEKTKIIKVETLKDVRKLSEDYPHILLASRESSTDKNVTTQVCIKEYNNVEEFVSELTIMEKIANLSIKIPSPRLYGPCEYKKLSKGNMPSFRLVMEKIEAPDLLTCMWSDSFNYVSRLRICMQLISLVKRLHNHGIVHMDIKCENLLVSMDEIPKLTIIDFALSMIVYDNNTYYHNVVGTKNYCSPEMYFRRKYLPKSNDIWSVGVVIYIILSGGFHPFTYKHNISKRSFYKNIIRKIRYGNIDPRIAGVLKCVFLPERKRLTATDLNNILIPVIGEIILETTPINNPLSPRRNGLVQTL